MYSIHPGYLGLLTDRKRKDAQDLRGYRPQSGTVKHKPAGRKWRLLGRW